MSSKISTGEFPLGDGRVALSRARPTSVTELCELVSDCTHHDRAIYPQGGCTALDFGGATSRPGMAIDLTGLCRVVDYPAADMTITVDAGITLCELQRVLGAERQRLPLDPPQAGRATLGGIYATNASGPRRFGSGRPRDLIIGIEFVSAGGTVVKGGGRVVKNVAGYDLPKLMTGALGTLGILTQLTLKVRPLPESSAVVWAMFENLAQVGTVLDHLNVSRTRPMAVELFNKTAARRLIEMGAPAPLAPWVLAIGYEDNRAAIDWQVETVVSELGREAAAVRGAEATSSWSAIIELAGVHPSSLAVQSNVRPSRLVALLAKFDEPCWSVQARAGSGIVLAHQEGSLDGQSLAEIERLIQGLRAESVVDGNLSLLRCPTEWKERLGVGVISRASAVLMSGIKSALDPHDLVNPGRLAFASNEKT